MLKKLAVAANIATDDLAFLAHHYDLETGSEADTTASWQLCDQDGVYRLSYMAQDSARPLAMTLDFRQGHYHYRLRHPSKEPLIKAIKVRQKLPSTVIDATPGVLKDSLMLASRGIQIVAIERNPLLYVMVRRALSCLFAAPKFMPSMAPMKTAATGITAGAMTYHFGDAIQHLPDFDAEMIYLDPMYPPKKKAAQVKKDMQILHALIGQDDDAETLLRVARQQSTRVVVKRPHYAKPLDEQPPDFTSQTGATRFDIYLPKK